MIDLPEPRTRALIACQIEVGRAPTGLERMWANRTYEVIRTSDGQWRVDFGEGALEPRRDWAAVLAWFWSLRPRNVELLEVP